MADELFESMKAYVAWSDEDAGALAELREPLRDFFPAIVDQFYDILLADKSARAILEAGTGRVENLRRTLLAWLDELFAGEYGIKYFEQRCRIGRVHVQVDLPQRYMFTAMNVIRLSLLEKLSQVGIADCSKHVRAIHKILDLELAIMNETYREDLIDQMKAIEQSRFEEKLSESEHLATIGQLAASLAHEIKNPLAGISGAIQVLGSGLDVDHPHKEVIDEALRQIDRLDATVKDLLVYARPKPPERTTVNLARVLDRALMLLKESPAFQSVTIVRPEADVDYEVEADEAQLQQVFSNLLLNAAHACEPAGTIQCRISRDGSDVRLTISDSGVGISQEAMARAFEPFFTTKAKGSGLGLPICRRIVEAHGGRMEIKSRAGHGTEVMVRIPSQS